MLPPRELSPSLHQQLELVEAEKDEFRALGEFDAATVDRLRVAFLPEIISDTLNIEGVHVNPRITLAVMQGNDLSEPDKYVETEVRNIIDAHQLLVDEVNRGFRLTPELIKRVNGEVKKDLLASAGQLRRTKVDILGAHVTPPPPEQLERRLDEVCELHSAYPEVHPIAKAAWLHREIAEAHPFEDGNGRTARLLQDLVLCAAEYLPVGIPAFRRQEYYDALQLGDAGDLEPLIAMIANSQLTALTRARRVVKDPDIRKKAVAQVLQGRSQAAARPLQREHDVWRRLVDGLLEECLSWANDLAEGAGGKQLMRVKQWDPLDYEGWSVIRSQGYATHSWVGTLFFSEPPAAGFSVLLNAKRLDKIPGAVGQAGPLASTVGLQLIVAEAGEKYDFMTAGDDYIRTLALAMTADGYTTFRREPGGDVAGHRVTVTEAIQGIVQDAALKAGWSE